VKELDSYLNDHLAGSVSALELLEHWVRVHDGEQLADFFRNITAEVRHDQEKLREVMHSLGIEESKLRRVGAWAAEKLGRARLIIAGEESGSVGLVLTLEGLIMGVTGKKLMWRAVAAANLPQLNGYDFEQLERCAEQQIERIEAERMRAVPEAFTGTNSSQ
jgi:hypothetical protein